MSHDDSGPDSVTADTGAPVAVKAQKPTAQQRPKSQKLPPFNVILLDDNDHTYDYVVMMLRRVFGHPEPRGMQLARQVDQHGRAIVLTTHRELAELKRDQILSFGADPRIQASRGSMGATIEPAE